MQSEQAEQDVLARVSEGVAWLAALAVAATIGHWLGRGGVPGIALTLTVMAAAGTRLVWITRMRPSVRSSIAAVTGLCILITMAFGGVYWLMANHRPTRQFAFDSRLVTQREAEQIAELEIQVRDDARARTGLLALKAHCLMAQPDLSHYEVELSIGGGWKFSRYQGTIPTSDLDRTMFVSELTDPEGESLLRGTDHYVGLTDRRKQTERVLDARTSDGMVAEIDKLLGQYAVDRDRKLTEINELSRRAVGLNVVDYLYFSVCVFTTVGSGDILPCATMSRSLVAIEAILAVLVLAFGADLLGHSLVSEAARAAGKG